MDRARANRLATELTGTPVGGWIVGDLLGNGKSALALAANQNGADAALKVFDPELVERFGEDVQLARIKREALLRGSTHPNLVQILDGGRYDKTGYLYVTAASNQCLTTGSSNGESGIMPRRHADNLTIPEMLALLADDYVPLDDLDTWDERHSQLVAVAEEYVATSASPITATDDQTGWPSDETVEAFLAWLRERGTRLLARPAGLFA